METAERRQEIIRVLCRRRHEKVENLAHMFGVSTRTILRDVERLSLTHPIYTQCGPYGGVYVMPGYTIDRLYMSTNEMCVIQKMTIAAEMGSVCELDDNEKSILQNMITQYTKPTSEKGKNYEQKRKTII